MGYMVGGPDFDACHCEPFFTCHCERSAAISFCSGQAPRGNLRKAKLKNEKTVSNQQSAVS